MKLTVLLGPAGSGKTFRSMEGLRNAERAGRRGLLFVPDQFTYAADRLLLEDSGFAGTRLVRILSFSRLAHLVCHQPAITEMGRRMLLRRVVHEMDSATLGHVANLRGRIGLVDALAGAIKELRAIAGPQTAARLAEAAGDDARLRSLSAIIAAYDLHLAGAGQVDPQDRHHLAAGLIADSEYGHNAPIWVDGFASFTPAEKALLKAMLGIVAEATITLCCDPEDADIARKLAAERSAHGVSPGSVEFMRELRGRLSRPVFLPTLRTMLWLEMISGGTLTIERLRSSAPRFGPESPLASIEKGLFGRTIPSGAPLPTQADTTDTAQPAGTTVSLTAPAHPYEEVRQWARHIDHWTRLSDHPIRCREIALLVRNLEAYRPLIREVFGRYGISHFIDERRDVTAHPVIRFCLSVLELAAGGWSRENVLSILRNPLIGLSPLTCDLLENFSLEYGIEYDVWFQTEWAAYRLPDREPTGPDTSTDPEPGRDSDRQHAKADREDRRRHLAAKEIRARVVPFIKLLKQFQGQCHGDEQTFGLYAKTLTDVQAECVKLSNQEGTARTFDATWTPEEDAHIRSLLAETFELGETLLGSLPMDVHLFKKLIRDALQGATIGVTPRNLDAVTVAEPRRARVNEIRRVIMGGVDAASFPRTPVPDPILTDPQREHLTAHGLPIMPVADTHIEEDPYLFYIACTRATEELWVTHPRLDLAGGANEPSPYLDDLVRAAGVCAREPAELPPDGSGETAGTIPGGSDPATIGARLAHCIHAHDLTPALAAVSAPMTLTDRTRLLSAAAEQLPSLKRNLSQTEHCAAQVRDPLPRRLGDDLLDDLYDDGSLRTSASGIETFARCPYQHFAKQVLRLAPRLKAVLTPRSTGSAVHEALHQLFRPGEVPQNEEAAARTIKEIFERLSKDAEYEVFQVHPPSAYQWNLTRRRLQLFARTETRRLTHGHIEPAGAELGFGLKAEDDELEWLRSVVGKQLGDTLSADHTHLPPLSLTLPTDLIGRQPTGGHALWQVRLRGRIDRLDLLRAADGSYRSVVIDYKSSVSYRDVFEGLPLGIDLQIATYLLVAKELGLEPAAGLYYSFKPFSRKAGDKPKEANPYKFAVKGLYNSSAADQLDPEHAFGMHNRQGAPKGLADGEMEAHLEAARRQIQLLTAGILRGHVRPYPLPQKGRLPCEHCDAKPMCRFRARAHPTRRPVTGGEDEL